MITEKLDFRCFQIYLYSLAVEEGIDCSDYLYLKGS